MNKEYINELFREAVTRYPASAVAIAFLYAGISECGKPTEADIRWALTVINEKEAQ